jgi:hypothetical protein
MTEGSELMCIVCGRDAGYNRAVVDTLSDELVGGLCLGCERTSYGTDLNGTATHDPNCTLCAHDGFFALPKWRIERPSAPAQRTSLTVGYAVGSGTARLCDGHFHELERAVGPATADAPDGREPYDRL